MTLNETEAIGWETSLGLPPWISLFRLLDLMNLKLRVRFFFFFFFFESLFEIIPWCPPSVSSPWTLHRFLFQANQPKKSLNPQRPRFKKIMYMLLGVAAKEMMVNTITSSTKNADPKKERIFYVRTVTHHFNSFTWCYHSLLRSHDTSVTSEKKGPIFSLIFILSISIHLFIHWF